MSTEKDENYPYVYSADFLRRILGDMILGANISRSDASQLRRNLALALGIPDEEMAKRLADYYLEKAKFFTGNASELIDECLEFLNTLKPKE